MEHTLRDQGVQSPVRLVRINQSDDCAAKHGAACGFCNSLASLQLLLATTDRKTSRCKGLTRYEHVSVHARTA
jgi:hypothetical protein